MERPASRLGRAASRQQRTRPRLCKRCAVSTQRRNCGRSLRGCLCSKLPRRNNLFRYRFEPRIAAQWVDERVNSNPPYVRTGAILITLFKPAESLLFVAEREINNRKAIR